MLQAMNTAATARSPPPTERRPRHAPPHRDDGAHDGMDLPCVPCAKQIAAAFDSSCTSTASPMARKVITISEVQGMEGDYHCHGTFSSSYRLGARRPGGGFLPPPASAPACARRLVCTDGALRDGPAKVSAMGSECVTAEILNESHNEPRARRPWPSCPGEGCHGDASSCPYRPADHGRRAERRHPPGELLIIGGAFGVGKTIFGLGWRAASSTSTGSLCHLYLLRARPCPSVRRVPGERRAEGADAALTLRQLMDSPLARQQGAHRPPAATPRYHPMLDAIDTTPIGSSSSRPAATARPRPHSRLTKDVAARAPSACGGGGLPKRSRWRESEPEVERH